MVSRSIHSAMMIYSAHEHAESERDTETQTDMHTQLIHDVYIVSCSNTQEKNIQINLWKKSCS